MIPAGEGGGQQIPHSPRKNNKSCARPCKTFNLIVIALKLIIYLLFKRFELNNISKELCFHHKITFSTVYFHVTLKVRLIAFQIMVFVMLDSNSLKWEVCNTSGHEYIDISKSDFVIKTQFLLQITSLQLLIMFKAIKSPQITIIVQICKPICL